MRVLIPILILMYVQGLTCPALSAGSNALQAARRACMSHFGGTSEPVKIDKKHGYVLCRGHKGREFGRAPFNWGTVDKPRSSEGNNTELATPRINTKVPPIAKEECRGCEVKKESGKVQPPSSTTLQKPDTTQDVTPAQDATTPHSTPSNDGSASTRTAKENQEKIYGSDLLEHARTICVNRYGSLATVDYIDDRTWEVVCKKP